jgi:hypothetical protein
MINKEKLNLFNILISLLGSVWIYFLLFLFLLLAVFLSEDLLFATAHADSGSDTEPEPENQPKVDKGKQRAVDTEFNEPKRDKGKGKIIEIDDDDDVMSLNSEKRKKADYKKHLELLDFEFAMALQQEEQANWENSNRENSSMHSLNTSSPSVVSTEIHSDDSDRTRQRKLGIREIEKSLLLAQGLNREPALDPEENPSRKRRYPFDDDEDKPESSKKK